MAKVLAVEDDSDIQIVLKMVLTRLGKCEVVLSGEGTPVVDLAREHQPAFILLDVMLPDMSGTEVIQRLKADPATKDIPVIFLTARSIPSEAQEALSLGALGYLAKPFEPMALVPQINALLSKVGNAITIGV